VPVSWSVETDWSVSESLAKIVGFVLVYKLQAVAEISREVFVLGLQSQSFRKLFEL